MGVHDFCDISGWRHPNSCRWRGAAGMLLGMIVWIGGGIGVFDRGAKAFSLRPTVADALGIYTLASVFGPDDRRPVPANHEDFQAVGVISTALGRGTGTLVGCSLVLTTAHLLYREEGPGEVVPLLPRGSFIIDFPRNRRPTPFTLVAYGTQRPDGALTRAGDDWALLRLKRSLCPTYEPLPVKAFPAQAVLPLRVTNVAYHDDLFRRPGGKRLFKHEACQITERDPFRGVLLNDCDLTGGASGSPLLQRLGQRWVVIGVQKGAMMVEDVNGKKPYRRATANVGVAAERFLKGLEGLK